MLTVIRSRHRTLQCRKISEPMAAGLSHHAFSVILYNGTRCYSDPTIKVTGNDELSMKPDCSTRQPKPCTASTFPVI